MKKVPNVETEFLEIFWEIWVFMNMEFIISYLVISLSMIFVFYMGETITTKIPGGRFSKWWRKNIIMEDPSNM